MKKCFSLLLSLLLVITALPVFAEDSGDKSGYEASVTAVLSLSSDDEAEGGEEAEPTGETAEYRGLVVPVSSVNVNLDDAGLKVTNYKELEEFIAKLPNVEHFDMYSSNITYAQMDELATMFPSIKFGWTMKIGDHKVRTDTTAFSTLHNKKSTYHTAKVFDPLKYCWNIKALDIGHNKLDSLDFLSGLTELRILIIACDYVYDISALANLTKLEYLEIFKNQITDISPLANLTNLIDLNICFNRIKDYTPLYGLKNLERLWLYNSNTYTDSIPVPSETIAALKESLPDTYIDYKSYSTLGGWREHKRYFVLKEIFATSVFMEWDALDDSAGEGAKQ